MSITYSFICQQSLSPLSSLLMTVFYLYPLQYSVISEIIPGISWQWLWYGKILVSEDSKEEKHMLAVVLLSVIAVGPLAQVSTQCVSHLCMAYEPDV